MKRKACVCALLAAALLLCACGAAVQPETPAAPAVDDLTRNWYEVFVYSYADSDGDGIGDLPGLTGKLDYIAELGCNGLWLMPIMPSPSYHKYDVTDYTAIDPQYGSMEDFRALLAAAHARGIRVILDLPINHSSSEHPWFLSASQGEDSPYRDYYNWSDMGGQGYTALGDAYYESRFVDSMPDLNLDNPAVREEITEILDFWLTEIGVDGFRLDAVTSYYTGQTARNVEFLNWLADTAHGLDPDCFLVAEAWENLSTIAAYAESRVDSFFTFPVSQSEGYIAKVLADNAKAPGQRYAEYTLELERTLPASTIPAPFTENHDTGRTVGFTGRDNPAKTKMAGGLLCLMRGGVFVYYGQEIGMVGSGDDPNKRLGMLWTTEEETTTPPPGATRVEYVYPSVAAQLEDETSLLRYYQQALALRNRFPEIARGSSTVLPCENGDLCLLVRQWEDGQILLAVNPSKNEASAPLEGWQLAAQLLTGEEPVKVENGVIVLPAYSIAVLETSD